MTRELRIRCEGRELERAKAWTLTGPSADAMNLPETTVATRELETRVENGEVILKIEPLSLTVIELP